MRYNFQDILSRFEASSNPRFRALSDAVARRVLELLDAAGAPIDPPEPPAGLTASTDEVGRVSLNWAAVLGASSYNVYRAPGSGGAFAILTTTIASEHIDAGLGDGESYRYRVTAVNGSGESDPSNTAQGSTNAGGGGGDPLPDMVTGLQVTSSIGYVDLTWDAFTGSTVAAALERSSDGGATWSQLATVSTTTVRDEAVTIGGTYHYRAAGVNSAGQVSSFGASVSTTVQDGDVTPPPVPVLLGTTFRNKAIDLTWEGVVASDLLGYEVGYSTTPGDYSNVTPLMTGTSGTIVGLTNGTRYYMAVRSVDASTNRNVSAWSNEKDNVAIDEALPGPPPPAPDAPTIIQGWSPYTNGVRITFEPAAGATNLGRHRLYMRYTDAPAGQAWFQVDQAQEPIRTLGAGVTIYQGSQSWGEMPVPVEYAVASVDTYNQESPLSVPVVVAHDGSDYEAGAGEGAVGNGDINGLTLSPNHKVHGVMFDAVIDVSDPTSYPGDAMERAAAEWNRRTSSFPTAADHIPLSVDDAIVVAVLLPAQTVNKRLKINRGATSVGGTNPVEAANFEFYGDEANPTQVELHFVGPWTCGGDDFQEAMDRVADQPDTLTTGYGRTFKDEFGRALLADNVGTDIEIENITKQGAEGAFYFWNWDVEITSKYGALLGSNADRGGDIPSAKFDVVFGLTRFHQDAVEPQNERLGDHLVSSRYVRPSFLGCYLDAPWQRKSAVHVLSPAQGDFTFNTVRVRRAGESGIELMTRRPVDVGLAENDSAGQLAVTSVRHWDENPAHVGGVGRSGQLGAPFFKCRGIEQAVVFSNCEVLEEIATNFTPAWPVSDPYDFRIATSLVNMTNPAISFTDMGDARRNADGFAQGPVSFSGCLFYSRNPYLPVVDIDSAVSVTLTDTAAFTGETQDVVAYADVTGNVTEVVGQTAESYRYGAASPPNPGQGFDAIGPFNATGLNTAQHRVDIQAVTGMTADKIRTTNSSPVLGNYTVDWFDCTQDHSWTRFTAPYVPYAQPVELEPGDPSANDAIDAIGMYDAGLTRAEAKVQKLPALRASRAPKTQTGQSVALRSWAYKPGDPSANAGDYEIYFGSHLSGPPTHPFVTWSPDYSDFLMENVELFTNGVDRGYTGHYPRRKDDPLFPTSSSNQHPLVPNGVERVFAKEFHDRWGTPTGNKWTMRNCFLYDAAYPKKSSGDGVDRTKWLIRAYDYEDFLIEDCDFEYLHIEHANYINSSGNAEWKNCTFRYIGGQGVQLAHRSDDWGKTISDPYGAENAQYLSTEHNRKFDNCHFIDVSNWSYAGSNKSSNINLYCSGYPDNPCELVLFKDCSWVQGMTVAEGIQERIDAGDPEGGNYMYRSGQNVSGVSLVACLIEDQGGGSQNGNFAEGSAGSPISTELFKTPFSIVANARDDNAATIHKVIYFKNCYLSQMDARNPMIRIDSATTVIFEDCVLIHEEVYGTTQRMFSFDSGLSAYCEPGAYNYMENGDLHTTHNVIFRNCRVEMREVTESGVVTSVSPASMAWNSPFDGSKTFIGVGNSENEELHFTGFQNGQTPQLAYQGPIDPNRPGYIAPPAI